MAGHRGARRFYDQIDLALIFVRSKLADERLHLSEADESRKRLSTPQPGKRLNRRRFLVVPAEIGINWPAIRFGKRSQFVVHFVERLDFVKSGDSRDLLIARSQFGPQPLFFLQIARRQKQNFGVWTCRSVAAR